jgi:hypothetical protein
VIRALKALFGWRTIAATGVWRYQQNIVTGWRRAVRCGSGYQPRDVRWLTHQTDHLFDDAGRQVMPPCCGTSGVRR